MTHKLKTWPEYFEKVYSLDKLFEVRKNDRNFKVGDTLILEEYDANTKTYSGRRIACQVTYILYGGSFGIEQGYCVMSLSVGIW